MKMVQEVNPFTGKSTSKMRISITIMISPTNLQWLIVVQKTQIHLSFISPAVLLLG